MKRSYLYGLVVAASFATTSLAYADTIFLSTQLRPIEEATVVREQLLKDVKTPVEYVVEEPPQFAVRMEAERQAGKHTISLVGALHGELSPIAAKGGFVPLDDMAAKLAAAGMPKTVIDLGKLGTDKQQYIPWMQATYVMAANKEALQYLPEGADINALTYDQLIAWGKKMQEATGQPRIGFPAGPKGLMPRFFQGYFYPPSLAASCGRSSPLMRSRPGRASSSSGRSSIRTRPTTTSCRSRCSPRKSGSPGIIWRV